MKQLNEIKQVFNTYKVQRQKEEKEEERRRLKQNKEELEKFLTTCEHMNSSIKYAKAEKIFSHLSVWLNVPEKERKLLYEDILVVLEKKEKEDAKNMRKRNIKALKDILESMQKVTYKTRWSEAQKLLFKDPNFTRDMDLQNMDKEDALIVFEEHIRTLEREHTDETEKKKRWLRRQERKNREAYLLLLDELHEQGKLTPISLWVNLYSTISADERFDAMLYQTGSTPLDLFKFYVDDLKVRYHDDKKLLKEIIKERKIEVNLSSTLDEFVEKLREDEKRFESLDKVNVKLVFMSLMEKAEQKEKEKQKEEHKKQKKLHSNFKSLLKKLQISEETKFDELIEKIKDEEAVQAISERTEQERVFNEFKQQLQEMCLHHLKRKKEKKQKKHKRERSKSSSSADSSESSADENELQAPDDSSAKHKKEHSVAMDVDMKSASSHHKKSSSHKKSKKRKKQKSESQSASEEGEER
jgi:pre-mRNA-processing factor 40